MHLSPSSRTRTKTVRSRTAWVADSKETRTCTPFRFWTTAGSVPVIE